VCNIEKKLKIGEKELKRKGKLVVGGFAWPEGLPTSPGSLVLLFVN